MLAQHPLLAICAQSLTQIIRILRVHPNRPSQLASRAALQRAARAGYGGRLWHEVKVEELHGLEFDVAGGRPRLEDGRDGEEAVELLKGAGVAGSFEQSDDEDEEGGGLDGWAVDGLEEVEEKLLIL